MRNVYVAHVCCAQHARIFANFDLAFKARNAKKKKEASDDGGDDEYQQREKAVV